MSNQTPDLDTLLESTMLSDRHRLTQRWQRLKKEQNQDKLAALAQQVIASVERAEKRRQNIPKPTFEADLPVIERREEVKRAIADNQVIILCGETGSGKTTQLPKICLELGRGVTGMIGHTQPRRIAARTVATRIAEELQSEIGQTVGYKVRFHDHVNADRSYVKLMTDGILLAETQNDKFLNQYDTLIIDEAHERSLNIDFLLGYIKQLLPKRPDLKVIITSATIDTERFSKHFDNAPVIEVSGRTYPVDIRYRPLQTPDEESPDYDMVSGIVAAVDELCREGPGDVLIFLAGERDIRDVSEALRKHHPPQTEILPLFARQSAAEQNRVFKTGGQRRIILATNVAETSLTVPGIRYVVDPGNARISRYSVRNKVQRLPIEKISQSSANQRAGRCGRVAAGICIRLYDEEDFEARPAFTDPEILRTNLASVILQMSALKLGDPAKFPFINPPPQKMINDGYRLLDELDAVDRQRRITETGRQLAKLPIDPRIARMLLKAGDLGSLTEVLVIASALSIQDPRERPMDKQQAADEAHSKYKDERSDFIGFLKLWDLYHDKKKHLSQNKLRKYCKENFLSFLRLREWHDIHQQLHIQLSELKLKFNTQEAAYDSIHQALLSGLLSHIAVKTDRFEYTGARNLKLGIFPGSALHKKGPKWLMAAELVETGKLYARINAKIEPEWIEPIAGSLVKRQYSDPHWEKKPAQVVAFESVSLYGLPIVTRRRVHYGPLDPDLANQIFIREALVNGDWHCRAPFFRHNQSLIQEVELLEQKSRRRDVLVDEEILFDFYRSRIPHNIINGAGFEKWRKKAEKDDPKLLFLSKELLMQHEAEQVTADYYPDQMLVNRVPLKLEYHFEPGKQHDGITQTIPLSLLNQTSAERYEWLVPGLLRDKIVFLLKALPKSLRRHFIPVPKYADDCLKDLSPESGALLPALSERLRKLTGVEIDEKDWRTDELPLYLQMNFRLVDDDGKLLDESRDLNRLKQDWAREAAASFRQIPDSEYEKTGLTSWSFDALPEQITLEQNGLEMTAYPALIDKTDSVDLTLMDTAAQARQLTRLGLRRLFMLAQADAVKYLHKNLPGIKEMCLHYANVPPSPYGDKTNSRLTPCEQLKTDLIHVAFDRCFILEQAAIRSREAFEQRLNSRRGDLIKIASELAQNIASPLAEYHAIAKRLGSNIPLAAINAVNDIREQLGFLVYQGFVHDTPDEALKRLPVYCQAAGIRLDKLLTDPAKDRQRMAEVKPHWQKFISKVNKIETEAFYEYRWMLEEFRISLFAQELKTAYPISAKRLEKQWQQC
ncbi:ATP-dependent RNA helicase HrpA [Methylophaga sp. OBS1]|uniref:ATP-dependent RNA helicase HrpA n=1 Tax=Methylophaga sp. OBS1 TaxID=2991933 RepID=UPI00225ADDBC|nr:ATP-dependent RNA helicase HrpA [Methylophaga sp. OBS1]MCX4191170.1 ATP-dependent RNA helicase HrpA [Methylophaga sp. OBS1]MCX4191885.1 ATP-dependent RNA helicase HrpA [Methylophaga sp. OBS1]